MTPERWPEERLDELARDVHRHGEILAELREANAVSKERVGLAIKRSNDCLTAVENLEAYLHRRDEEQARERKSDRRWLVTTGLSSAGLVVAALAVFLDKI
jgi:hypothetical protein